MNGVQIPYMPPLKYYLCTMAGRVALVGWFVAWEEPAFL